MLMNKIMHYGSACERMPDQGLSPAVAVAIMLKGRMRPGTVPEKALFTMLGPIPHAARIL